MGRGRSRPFDGTKRRALIGLCALAALLQACASFDRNAVPEELAQEAVLRDFASTSVRLDPNASEESLLARVQATHDALLENGHRGPIDVLSISGGGENGAFGAGVLVGWTESGRRPQFEAVTGISTGALIAPLAFLGPKYDAALTEVYTNSTKEDIFRLTPVSGLLFGNALAQSTPLFEVISAYASEELIAEIAREHRRGRRLLIGTTNLDSGQPVMWDIGAIANSPSANRVDLIRKILLASASIPVALPPVEIEVEAGGDTYVELHADGGTSTQVFAYPPNIRLSKIARERGLDGGYNVYVISNSTLFQRYKEIDNSIIGIAQASISTLIGAQGIGDTYRIYAAAKRDGVRFRHISIPLTFTMTPKEPFDQEYMRALYQRGREMGRKQTGWENAPPLFAL